MDIIYEAGLKEFVSYLEKLLEEAFWPYNRVYRGYWKAQAFEKICAQGYQEAFTGKRDAKTVGVELAKEINEETLQFLMAHASGIIYGPDLTVFSQDISQKLLEIIAKKPHIVKKSYKLAL
jgi:hypothetical protein